MSSVAMEDGKQMDHADIHTALRDLAHQKDLFYVCDTDTIKNARHVNQDWHSSQRRQQKKLLCLNGTGNPC